MWYEIVPCAVIITAAITVPQVFSYYFQRFLQNGNPYRRDIATVPFDMRLFRRDKFLAGTPYKKNGLENIPDQ